MNARIPWLTQITATIIAPFTIIIGAYQLALLFPGQVEESIWEWFSSIIFIAALFPFFYLLSSPKKLQILRILFGSIVSLIFVYSALVMHIHSTCEFSSLYIDGKIESDELTTLSTDQNQDQNGC